MSKQREAKDDFADKRYQAAKALYNELLRNNPKDEAAKRRLNQCETNISNVNLQKKLNKELDDILINNNKSALQSFVSNNKGCADYELLKSLLSYYDNPNI